MDSLSTQIWPPVGVSVGRLANGAGPIRLAPVFEHRLLVHASPATWSVCRESGQRFLRQHGHIDIVPSGEEGGYDAETSCATLEVRVTPGLIDRVAEETDRPLPRSALQPRHMLEDDRISSLAWALDGEQRAAAPAGRLFVDSIGVALATRLLAFTTPMPHRPAGLSPAQLQRVFDYVEAHPTGRLTLAALARVAGASSTGLRHWFKLQTGMTVHRYVVRRRVERARTLLLQGELKASEVALASGFAHQSHMARWMRRELGLTPSELLGRIGM